MEPNEPNPSRPQSLPATAPEGSAPAAQSNGPTTFSLDRNSVTFGGLVSVASDAWRRDIGTWALATLLALVIGLGIPATLEVVLDVMSALGPTDKSNTPARALVDGLGIGVQILQSLIGGVLTMGLWAMAFNGLHGKPAPIAALFSQIRKVLKYLLQQIALWVPLALIVAAAAALVVWISVGTIDLDMPIDEAWVLVGPPLWWFAVCSSPVLIYVFLGVAFAVNELTFDDRIGPVDAIVRSWQIARGKRWLILGILIIAGVISSASVLLCGVGILFGAPFATLLVGGLYLALREGTDVPEADQRWRHGPH